ncbi:Uncharacterised protein [Mycobacteroides abscessus subsp. bolletii]|uniref:Uncharacterized protein n=1 Tax=Mycobacteroides abscessus subsp. bolletii TaxID=319705 RepID=A0A9Q7SAQ6_9MYCO|nr:Uncharacterised protein [Mycobacteroides abscessus subsp. bolletii]SHU13395.1 Uncharacterised protein [Mycobacteroides abscessus subsp. bolletii]SHW88147.1 Uncharacterised protein [Mycobacteroides abscessus subsp. bolletii]SKL93797.1 Uncharacterised protein [Mycobacteroides abscessus subsp. bolletii]SKM66781.1 Uncharacterised protein [Mycobacteroides abscessus subsp. bolletii]
MRTVATICVVAGLLAGCSTPAAEEGPSAPPGTTVPTVEPGVMPNLAGLQWSDVKPLLRKLGRSMSPPKRFP